MESHPQTKTPKAPVELSTLVAMPTYSAFTSIANAIIISLKSGFTDNNFDMYWMESLGNSVQETLDAWHSVSEELVTLRADCINAGSALLRYPRETLEGASARQQVLECLLDFDSTICALQNAIGPQLGSVVSVLAIESLQSRMASNTLRLVGAAAFVKR